jgi:hypothetical protein
MSGSSNFYGNRLLQDGTETLYFLGAAVGVEELKRYYFTEIEKSDPQTNRSSELAM